MGQWEVFGFLKENKGKWFTTRQICEQMGVSVGSVMGNVRKVREAGLIEFKTQTGGPNEIFIYRFKKV